jgi:hypothetical protein
LGQSVDNQETYRFGCDYNPLSATQSMFMFKGVLKKARLISRIKDKKVVAVTTQPEFKLFFDPQYDGRSTMC